MSPTASTILRNVLIETVCQVGSAGTISPKEGFGKFRFRNVSVRKRANNMA
jgi:hypothetical protein